MVEPHALKAWRWNLIGILGAWALAFTPVLLGLPHRGSPISPFRIVIQTLADGLAMAWLYVFMVKGFRALDEFVQAGSRFAWYWGGSAGLAASGPLAAFVGMGGLHWLWPASPLGAPLFRAFMIGYFTPVVTQVLGALAVSVWWWRAKH